MTNASRFLAIALASFSLSAAGCSRTFAEHGEPSRIPGAGLLDSHGDGYAIAGVIFNISPVSIRRCDHPDLRMQAGVTWNARAAGVRTVAIWVNDDKTPPKKWFYGGSQGHAATGNWIEGNTTLRMLDGATGKVLAVRHMHVTECLGARPGST
ncbi:MAG: hypothetical protein KGJ63_11475 [Pseudomonadota bacterium]|nr:hypothetical protein [Pseudomonadota bacterium]